MANASVSVTRDPTPAHRVEIVEPKHLLNRAEEVYDQIAKRAHALFEHRGLEHGHDLGDWLNAERDLLQPVPIELTERDDKINVRAEVRGFKQNDIKVSVEQRRLIISATSEAGGEQKTQQGVYSERTSNEVFRSLDLPADVNTDKASATLKDGILNIVLPKAAATTEPAKP